MKRMFAIITLAVIGTAASAQTRYDVKMTVDSVERQFIVVRPSGAVPAGGYPLVVMFHGTSGDGEKFYNISGWKEKGESEKFVTVFPSSLEYCFIDDSTGSPHRTTKWNCGEAEEAKCPGEYLKDDVKFVRLMLDTIAKTLPIDRRRVYASGFSNGGYFVTKLAVEMSDVFAAIAISAGGLHDLDAALPKRLIPLAYTIGDHDDRLTSALGIPAVPFNDSALYYTRWIVNRYLATFGLASSYTKDSTMYTITYRYTTPGAYPGASEYSFTLFKDMGHQYPNGVNYPVTIANPFWQFFRQYQSPLSVEDRSDAVPQLHIYPNPASTFLVVDGRGELTLTLSTLLGERVFTAAAAGGQRIQLPHLAGGLYVAGVSVDRKQSTQIIVLE
jgi:polyhydroxybutyrate depolymerase